MWEGELFATPIAGTAVFGSGRPQGEPRFGDPDGDGAFRQHSLLTNVRYDKDTWQTLVVALLPREHRNTPRSWTQAPNPGDLIRSDDGRTDPSGQRVLARHRQRAGR